jgi:hypothetical protein
LVFAFVVGITVLLCRGRQETALTARGVVKEPINTIIDKQGALAMIAP